MNTIEVKQLAAQFLVERRISFVPGGEVSAISDTRSEVTFLVPETLDPDVIVDPPDVRVVVDHESRKCDLVAQM